MTLSELGAHGLPAGNDLRYGGGDYVSLDSLRPDLTCTWDVNLHLITVTITIAASDFLPTAIDFKPVKPSGIDHRHSTSGFVNCDLHESVNGSQRATSLAWISRWPWGRATSRWPDSLPTVALRPRAFPTRSRTRLVPEALFKDGPRRELPYAQCAWGDLQGSSSVNSTMQRQCECGESWRSMHKRSIATHFLDASASRRIAAV
jgi:hypothetical protein